MSVSHSPRCPVCLDMIVEPVTLPCRHEICVQCFKMTLEVTAMSCPLCRKRISSWARKNAKNPVDKSRKEEIEREQQENAGGGDIPTCVRPGVSQPGEVRKEYLQELQQVSRGTSYEFLKFVIVSSLYHCKDALMN